MAAHTNNVANAPTLTSVCQEMANGIGKLGGYTITGINKVTTATKLNVLAEKVASHVKSLSTLYFLGALAVNCYFGPLTFCAGVFVGLATNTSIIKSDESKAKFLLFTVLSPLAFHPGFRAIASGITFGSYLKRGGASEISEKLPEGAKVLCKDAKKGATAAARTAFLQ